MSIVDNEKQAVLRNESLKENSEKIKIEGIDADETYITEIVKRSRANEVILDIGAGTAYFTIKIAKRTLNVEIIALDLSSASIRIAKDNVSNVKDGIFSERADLTIAGKKYTKFLAKEHYHLPWQNGGKHPLGV